MTPTYFEYGETTWRMSAPRYFRCSCHPLVTNKIATNVSSLISFVLFATILSRKSQKFVVSFYLFLEEE